MGCWDIFCFICGNPCHSLSLSMIKIVEKERKENIKSTYTTHAKNKLKKLKSSDTIIDDLKKLSTDWMNKCSILLVNDTIIHGVTEESCNIEFIKNNKSYIHNTDRQECFDNFNCGIFIHTDCWKYIKLNYNVELKYSYLPKPISSNIYKVFDIDYGEIEKYWGQEFEFVDIVLDKKSYLLSSPLKNNKNIKQIKKNIKDLKIKFKNNRKGPFASAGFYDEGDIKIGMNGNLWIVSNKKWREIKEKSITIKL